MTLGISSTSPFESVHVSLDLETTGLDQDRDTIIEVGAVKFQGGQVIDTFQTLVNPGRTIPDFIQRLTGIKPGQVARAPFFSSIAHELDDFLEHHPVIGHNVRFDLGFLSSHGLQLQNPAYDTWDLASMLLPYAQQYSLAYLSDHFKVDLRNHHRALADASATHQVFVQLLRRAEELDPGLLAHLAHLSLRSRWSISPLLTGLQQGMPQGTAAAGLTGLDTEALAARLGRPEKRRADSSKASLDEDKIINLLGAQGPFAQSFSGFELRPEQEEMLSAVTRAVFNSRHLAVEGGTGVGKSIAYLLPAVLFAAAHGQRVVVSTNTINLQEQLMKKDIPALLSVLEEAGLVEPGAVKAALLKGRNNYLCLHRWNYLARSENPTVEDARVLSKTAVWLQDTVTGDKGEINLSGRDGFVWSRVSAGEKAWCPGLRDGGPCFLRSARERADQAHVVVVNHALLLSDLVRGGGLIPDYRYLIVDEAHHLEDEATRQLGFSVTRDRLEEALELQGRLAVQVRMALGAEGMTTAIRREGERAVSDAETGAAALRELVGPAVGIGRGIPGSPEDGLVRRPAPSTGRPAGQEQAIVAGDCPSLGKPGSADAAGVAGPGAAAAVPGVNSPAGGGRPACAGDGGGEHPGQPGRTAASTGVDCRPARRRVDHLGGAGDFERGRFVPRRAAGRGAHAGGRAVRPQRERGDDQRDPQHRGKLRLLQGHDGSP